MRQMPPIHPAANLFPMLPADELQVLADDIKANGLQQPIVLFGAQLLDGRNRWRACELAGVEPKLKDWSGKDPIAYVVSLNLKRRHMNESQRSMVAGRVAQMRRGDNQHGSIDLTSQSEAAEMLNVSVPSVKRARVVLDHGSPELAAAVDKGAVAVSTAADLTELSPDEQREVVARGEKEILAAAKEIRARKNETRRQERVDNLVEISRGNADLKTTQRYPLILADPPWRYEHVETESRAIENQYPTMALEEICALNLDAVSTDDCVLFMWATSPKLAEAMDVLANWKFNYRTCAVWVKDKIGMGYYFRQKHELLLVATRGTPPTPAPSDRLSSVIEAVRGKHSAKPVEFYEVIERMYPTLPKLENVLQEAARWMAGVGQPIVNDFAKCLEQSHKASDWPGWAKLYQEAFPTFAAIVDHRQNGEHQKAGIDRSIILANSKQILVDEKVRGKNKLTQKVYEDIALEFLSNSVSKAPGWVVKELRADYIAYLIAPLGRCYLLPVIQLQLAWARNGSDWKKQYGTISAENNNYRTYSCPVPVSPLFLAIGSGLRLSFDPFEVLD